MPDTYKKCSSCLYWTRRIDPATGDGVSYGECHVPLPPMITDKSEDDIVKNWADHDYACIFHILNEETHEK